MENLKLEATNKTPYIEFNADNGSMTIEGMSLAENAAEFYKPVLEWLDDYMQNPCKKTTLDVKLNYFNTSSAKNIFDILEKLSSVKENGNKVTINWYFKKVDEDMQEAGENFSELLEMPFNFKEIK